MANHLRRQIREAVATAVTGLTTTGSRVYQSRVYPLERAANLPGLLVFSTSESVEVTTVHSPRMYQRRLQLQVRAVAAGVADLDDTLDGICKEVEAALAWPVSALYGKAKLMTLTGTEIEFDAETQQPIGAATMTFEVEYFTNESAPDVAL